MNMDTDTVIDAHDLVRTYDADTVPVHALDHVHLHIARGEFVALRGPSGSGKTTLLNMIGGLDTPTSGNIFFLGQNTATLSQDQLTDIRRDKIGFIFQAFALLPILSAWENVELPLRIAGMRSGKERRQRALEALTLVGLEQWADHRPSEMSGGQQQRVAIARALVSRPPILIADEPTGELDSTTGKNLLTLMRTIVKSEGVTLIMATHDQSVHQYADIIHHMRDGQVYESIPGTFEEAPAQA
jgi:ABC-type lipoprotein export system ATPase subunit